VSDVQKLEGAEKYKCIEGPQRPAGRLILSPKPYTLPLGIPLLEREEAEIEIFTYHNSAHF